MTKKKQFITTLVLGFASIILLSSIASWASANSSQLNASLPAQVQSILPENLQWQLNPDVPGVESAIALGNPTSSELYVMFGKMAANTEFPPHTHPDPRITTVVSGLMYYGVGETSDRASMSIYPAGSVVYTPANTPHYMRTENQLTVMQEMGKGPSGLKFMVNQNS